jgi:hypothetical protein
MKKYLLLALLPFLPFLPSITHAATITAAAGGGQWTSTSTWTGGVVPTATDDAICTNTSGNVSVGTNGVCKTLTTTGYTGTLTITDTKTLSVSGSVVLSPTTVTSGTGRLVLLAAGNLDTQGINLTWGLTLGSFTTTVLGNVDMDGLLSNSAGDSCLLTAAAPYTINVAGGFTATRRITTTNVTIILDGTGTCTGQTTSSARSCVVALTINTAGTITMTTPSITTGSTLTYTAGTIVWGTSRLDLWGNCSLLGAWPSFNDVYVNGATTLTIDNAFTAPGTVYLDNNLTMSGNYAVTVGKIITTSAATLTRVNAWTIDTMNSGYNAALTIAGDFDQTVADLGVNVVSTLKFPPGRTLTVSRSIEFDGTSDRTSLLQPTTTPNVIYLNYTGSVESQKVCKAQFSYVNASGSSTPIFNKDGRTLTSCTNIVNIGTANLLNILGFQ